MSLNAIATQSLFKGLKCPYTGKPITVRVVAHGNQAPMFFSPDAYDPAMPHTSATDLMEKVGTRNGIMGATSGKKSCVCPYTGHEMSLTATGSLFSFIGGFSPRSPHKDMYEFAKKLHMRDGKLTADPKLFERPRIALAEREPEEKISMPSDMPSDEAMESVEPLIASKFKRTSVAVPHGVPKSKKGG
jgi:hypothetical protein